MNGGYKTNIFYTDSDRLLDPLFWQALGKAEGWTTDGKTSRFSSMTFGEFEKRHWKTHWHSLIDHLAQGGDIDTFFNNLIK